MVDIIHRVGIKAPAPQVFNALSTIDGLSGWWTENTTGTSKVGGTIEFHFQLPSGELIGSMGMEVLKLELNKQVHWRCISGPPEWIGTDIIFDLSMEEPYTVVLFAHKNWREQTESTAHCSMKWATFLLSLKQLIETGRGKPAPNDVKIDNWN